MKVEKRGLAEAGSKEIRRRDERGNNVSYFPRGD